MANQICISSDVEASFMTLSGDVLSNVQSLNIALLHADKALLQIRDSKLTDIANEIESLLEELIKNRKEVAEQIQMESLSGEQFIRHIIISEISYKDQIIRVNFRDKNDAKLCNLISLLDTVLVCIKYQGSLYIYNSDLLNKYESVSIVGFLRNRKPQRKADIEYGIKELWKALQIDAVIDMETIEKGLSLLQEHALVYYDKEGDRYTLTARGYMFW